MTDHSIIRRTRKRPKIIKFDRPSVPVLGASGQETAPPVAVPVVSMVRVLVPGPDDTEMELGDTLHVGPRAIMGVTEQPTLTSSLKPISGVTVIWNVADCPAPMVLAPGSGEIEKAGTSLTTNASLPPPKLGKRAFGAGKPESDVRPATTTAPAESVATAYASSTSPVIRLPPR